MDGVKESGRVVEVMRGHNHIGGSDGEHAPCHRDHRYAVDTGHPQICKTLELRKTLYLLEKSFSRPLTIESGQRVPLHPNQVNRKVISHLDWHCQTPWCVQAILYT